MNFAIDGARFDIWVWYQYQYNTARIVQAQYATTIYVSFFFSCVIYGRNTNNLIMPHKRNPNANRAAQRRQRKWENKNRGERYIFDKVKKPTNSSKKYGLRTLRVVKLCFNK